MSDNEPVATESGTSYLASDIHALSKTNDTAERSIGVLVDRPVDSSAEPQTDAPPLASSGVAFVPHVTPMQPKGPIGSEQIGGSAETDALVRKSPIGRAIQRAIADGGGAQERPLSEANVAVPGGFKYDVNGQPILVRPSGTGPFTVTLGANSPAVSVADPHGVADVAASHLQNASIQRAAPTIGTAADVAIGQHLQREDHAAQQMRRRSRNATDDSESGIGFNGRDEFGIKTIDKVRYQRLLDREATSWNTPLDADFDFEFVPGKGADAQKVLLDIVPTRDSSGSYLKKQQQAEASLLRPEREAAELAYARYHEEKGNLGFVGKINAMRNGIIDTSNDSQESVSYATHDRTVYRVFSFEDKGKRKVVIREPIIPGAIGGTPAGEEASVDTASGVLFPADINQDFSTLWQFLDSRDNKRSAKSESILSAYVNRVTEIAKARWEEHIAGKEAIAGRPPIVQAREGLVGITRESGLSGEAHADAALGSEDRRGPDDEVAVARRIATQAGEVAHQANLREIENKVPSTMDDDHLDAIIPELAGSYTPTAPVIETDWQAEAASLSADKIQSAADAVERDLLKSQSAVSSSEMNDTFEDVNIPGLKKRSEFPSLAAYFQAVNKRYRQSKDSVELFNLNIRVYKAFIAQKNSRRIEAFRRSKLSLHPLVEDSARSGTARLPNVSATLMQMASSSSKADNLESIAMAIPAVATAGIIDVLRTQQGSSDFQKEAGAAIAKTLTDSLESALNQRLRDEHLIDRAGFDTAFPQIGLNNSSSVLSGFLNDTLKAAIPQDSLGFNEEFRTRFSDEYENRLRISQAALLSGNKEAIQEAKDSISEFGKKEFVMTKDEEKTLKAMRKKGNSFISDCIAWMEKIGRSGKQFKLPGKDPAIVLSEAAEKGDFVTVLRVLAMNLAPKEYVTLNRDDNARMPIEKPSEQDLAAARERIFRLVHDLLLSDQYADDVRKEVLATENYNLYLHTATGLSELVGIGFSMADRKTKEWHFSPIRYMANADIMKFANERAKVAIENGLRGDYLSNYVRNALAKEFDGDPRIRVPVLPSLRLNSEGKIHVAPSVGNEAKSINIESYAMQAIRTVQKGIQDQLERHLKSGKSRETFKGDYSNLGLDEPRAPTGLLPKRLPDDAPEKLRDDWQHAAGLYKKSQRAEYYKSLDAKRRAALDMCIGKNPVIDSGDFDWGNDDHKALLGDWLFSRYPQESLGKLTTRKTQQVPVAAYMQQFLQNPADGELIRKLEAALGNKPVVVDRKTFDPALKAKATPEMLLATNPLWSAFLSANDPEKLINHPFQLSFFHSIFQSGLKKIDGQSLKPVEGRTKSAFDEEVNRIAGWIEGQLGRRAIEAGAADKKIKASETVSFWSQNAVLAEHTAAFLSAGNEELIKEIERQLRQNPGDQKLQDDLNELQIIQEDSEKDPSRKSIRFTRRQRDANNNDLGAVAPDMLADYVQAKSRIMRDYSPVNDLSTHQPIPVGILAGIVKDSLLRSRNPSDFILDLSPAIPRDSQATSLAAIDSVAADVQKEIDQRKSQQELEQSAMGPASLVPVTESSVREIMSESKKKGIIPIGRSSHAYPATLRGNHGKSKEFPVIYTYGFSELVESPSIVHLISDPIAASAGAQYGAISSLGDVQNAIRTVSDSLGSIDGMDSEAPLLTRKQHIDMHVTTWMQKLQTSENFGEIDNIIRELNKVDQNQQLDLSDMYSSDWTKKFSKLLERYCQSNAIAMITPADSAYPPYLLKSPGRRQSGDDDPTPYTPSVLFVKGNPRAFQQVRDNSERVVTCIGVGEGKTHGEDVEHGNAVSQKACEVVTRLSSAFKDKSWTIVTSLTGGTNDAILQTALRWQMPTIIVAPFGFNTSAELGSFGPRFKDAKSRLNDALDKNAVVMTECLPGMGMQRPKNGAGRDSVREHQRLLAELSSATIVISATGTRNWVQTEGQRKGISPEYLAAMIDGSSVSKVLNAKVEDSIPIYVAQQAARQKRAVFVLRPDTIVNHEAAMAEGRMSGNVQLTSSSIRNVFFLDTDDPKKQLEKYISKAPIDIPPVSKAQSAVEDILNVAQMSRPQGMTDEEFLGTLSNVLVAKNARMIATTRHWLSGIKAQRNPDGSPVSVLIDSPDTDDASLRNLLLAKEMGVHTVVVPSQAIYSRTRMPDEYEITEEGPVLKKLNSLDDWAPLKNNDRLSGTSLIELTFRADNTSSDPYRLTFETPELAFAATRFSTRADREALAGLSNDDRHYRQKLAKIRKAERENKLSAIRPEQAIKEMYEILRQKFNSETYRTILMHTGTADIVHGSDGEDFWGVPNFMSLSKTSLIKTGIGNNMLGKLLMHIRSFISAYPSSRLPKTLSDDSCQRMLDGGRKRDETMAWHEALGLMGLSDRDITLAPTVQRAVEPLKTKELRIGITGSRDLDGLLTEDMVRHALERSIKIARPGPKTISPQAGADPAKKRSAWEMAHGIDIANPGQASDALYTAHSIVHGGAAGVDSVAAAYFRDHNFTNVTAIPYEELSTKEDNFHRKDRTAGHRRNTKIVADCDVLVAIWDGKSAGTLDAIMKGIRMQKRMLIWTPDGKGGLALQKINPAEKGTITLSTPFSPVVKEGSAIHDYHHAGANVASSEARAFAEKLRTASLVLGLHHSSRYAQGLYRDSRTIGAQKPIIVLGGGQSHLSEGSADDQKRADSELLGFFPADQKLTEGLIYKGRLNGEWNNYHHVSDPDSYAALGYQSTRNADSFAASNTAASRALQEVINARTRSGYSNLTRSQLAAGLGALLGLGSATASQEDVKSHRISDIDTQILETRLNPLLDDAEKLEKVRSLEEEKQKIINEVPSRTVALAKSEDGQRGLQAMGHGAHRSIPYAEEVAPSNHQYAETAVVSSEAIPHIYASISISMAPSKKKTNVIDSTIHVMLYHRDGQDDPIPVQSMVYHIPDSPLVTTLAQPSDESAHTRGTKSGRWLDGYGNYRRIIRMLSGDLAKDLLARYHAGSIHQEVRAITRTRDVANNIPGRGVGIPLQIAPQSDALTSLQRQTSATPSVHAFDPDSVDLKRVSNGDQLSKDAVDRGRPRIISQEQINAYVGQCRARRSWPPVSEARISQRQREDTRASTFNPRYQFTPNVRKGDKLSPLFTSWTVLGGETTKFEAKRVAQDSLRSAYGQSQATLAERSAIQNADGTFKVSANPQKPTTTALALFGPATRMVRGAPIDRETGGNEPYNINILALLGGSPLHVSPGTGHSPIVPNDAVHPEYAYVAGGNLSSAITDLLKIPEQGKITLDGYSDAALCVDLQQYLQLSPKESLTRKQLEPIVEDLLRRRIGGRKALDQLDYGRPVDNLALVAGVGAPMSIPAQWDRLRDSLFYLGKRTAFSEDAPRAVIDENLQQAMRKSRLKVATGLELLASLVVERANGKSASPLGAGKTTTMQDYLRRFLPPGATTFDDDALARKNLDEHIQETMKMFVFLRSIDSGSDASQMRIFQQGSGKTAVEPLVKNLRNALSITSTDNSRKIISQMGYLASAMDVMNSMNVDFNHEDKISPESTIAKIFSPSSASSSGKTKLIIVPGSVWQAKTIPGANFYDQGRNELSPPERMNLLANVIVCSRNEEINKIFLGITAGTDKQTQAGSLSEILDKGQKGVSVPEGDDHYVYIGCPLGEDIGENVLHFDETKSAEYKASVALAMAHAANIKAGRKAGVGINLASDDDRFRTLQQNNVDKFNRIASMALNAANGTLSADHAIRERQVRALVWATLYVDGVHDEKRKRQTAEPDSPVLVYAPEESLIGRYVGEDGNGIITPVERTNWMESLSDLRNIVLGNMGIKRPATVISLSTIAPPAPEVEETPAGTIAAPASVGQRSRKEELIREVDDLKAELGDQAPKPVTFGGRAGDMGVGVNSLQAELTRRLVAAQDELSTLVMDGLSSEGEKKAADAKREEFEEARKAYEQAAEARRESSAPEMVITGFRSELSNWSVENPDIFPTFTYVNDKGEQKPFIVPHGAAQFELFFGSGAFSVSPENIETRMREGMEFVEAAKRLIREHSQLPRGNNSDESNEFARMLAKNSFRIPGSSTQQFVNYQTYLEAIAGWQSAAKADTVENRRSYMRMIRDLAIIEEQSAQQKMIAAYGDHSEPAITRALEDRQKYIDAASALNAVIDSMSASQKLICRQPEKIPLADQSSAVPVELMQSKEYDHLKDVAKELKDKMGGTTFRLNPYELNLILTQHDPANTIGNVLLRGTLFSKGAPLIHYLQSVSLESDVLYSPLAQAFRISRYFTVNDLITVLTDLRKALTAEKKKSDPDSERIDKLTSQIHRATGMLNAAAHPCDDNDKETLFGAFDRFYAEASRAFALLLGNRSRKLEDMENIWKNSQGNPIGTLRFWRDQFMFVNDSERISGQIEVETNGNVRPAPSYEWTQAKEWIPLRKTSFQEWIRRISPDIQSQNTTDQRIQDFNLLRGKFPDIAKSLSSIYKMPYFAKSRRLPKVRKKRTGLLLRSYDKITYRA